MAVAILASAPCAASAASITQEFRELKLYERSDKSLSTSARLEAKRFNTELGTLNSVDFFASYIADGQFDSLLKLESNEFAIMTPGGGHYQLLGSDGTFAFADAAVGESGSGGTAGYGQAPTLSYKFEPPLGGLQRYSTTENIAYYINNDAVYDLSINNYFPSTQRHKTGENGITEMVEYYWGSEAVFSGSRLSLISLTYNYTPAVPEPGTWAMMLFGFCMIGATMRFHRRRMVVTVA